MKRRHGPRERDHGRERPAAAEAPLTVRVRVTPRSGRDALAGWEGGVLRVRLAAPPVEGRANEALCRLLAETVGLPPRDVRLLSGARGREKLVAFDGIEAGLLRRRLGIPPAQAI